MRGSGLFSLIYVFVVVLCVAFSTYTTFAGSLSFVGGWLLATAFSAIVAGCLFAADMRIRDDMLWNGGIRRMPVVLLVIAVAFSSLSHFNFFFTTFQGGEIARDAFRTQVASFEANMAVARGVLADQGPLKDYNDKAKIVEDHLKRLRFELDDPTEKGFGPDAEAVMQALLTQLGSEFPPLDPLTIGETDFAVINPWFENLSAAARDVVDRSQPTFAVEAVQTLKEIDEKRKGASDFEKTISTVGNAVDVQEIQAHGQSLADFSKRIRVELTSTGAAEAVQRFETIDPSAGRTGEIAFVLVRAFQTGNWIVTVLAFAFSLFVDLVPLLLALSLFRTRGGEGRPQASRPRNFGPRR